MEIKQKAVLFDFDGTLVDSIDVYKELFLKIFNKEGIKVEDKEVVSLFGMHPRNIFLKIVGSQNGFRSKALNLYNEFERMINNDSFFEKIELFPDVVNTLSYLKFHDVSLGIVSGSPSQIVREFLRMKGIEHYFDVVLGADDFKKDKPDPAGLLMAKEILGENKDYYYVGDWYVDALAANKAHMKFIAVLTGIFTKREAEKYPHYKIIERLGELKEIC